MHYGKPPAHIIEGLQVLRQRIDAAGIPKSVLDESLNVATWNIREFGRRDRLESSLYYIAEILYQFDLIALTELRIDLTQLYRVLQILGPEWDVVFSDFIPDRGGNAERTAFLYDRRMVTFTGLAAEADPPRRKNKATGEYEARFTWWRAPYLASFRAGSFDFVVLAAHARWGNRIAERENALFQLRQWVDERRRTKDVPEQDYIVLGDLNVPDRDSDAFKALTRGKGRLLLPEGLRNVGGTNLSRHNTYAQILHSPTKLSEFSGQGGVLDFYCNDWEALYPAGAPRPKNRRAFTYELSDHLPLWLQVKTDFSSALLNSLLGRRR